MKSIKIFALFFALLLIGQSCRKDSDNYTEILPTIEPQIRTISSVIGTVKDEQGRAVSDAIVWFENKSVVTDELGVFQFKDEMLYSSGTYIQVKKEGYFHGSRRFYPSKGNTSMINIELMPLNKVADFSSSEAKTVTFENVEMDFEANSIVKEDGSAYSGTVNVAAKYLDPTLLSTLNQMPGDLTGVAGDQSRVVLTSMAMIAVELLDDAGNELQVKNGKTVDVKIPVPGELQNRAPESIPMWHFDEEIGTWIEEGSANLVNGMYETSLAHFTFWNCDIPNDFIFLKGSVVNRGVPIQGVSVVVTQVDGGTSASTITDPNGFFCGYVPNGEDLLLEIFNVCGTLIYSTTIPASEIDVTLDPINLYIELNSATISGSVALCDGTPSPQTFISVSQGDLNNIISVNDDLIFSGNVFYCDENEELAVGATDPLNGLASNTITYSVEGDLDVGEIFLCEDQIIPIIMYEYGDISYSAIFYDNVTDDSTSVYYEIQTIEEGKDLYTVTVLNWNTNIVNNNTFLHKEGQPGNPAIIELNEAGFRANGTGSTNIVSQAGTDFFVSTGTLPFIEVTNQTLFDESYTELFYYIAFELE
ncbi:MAG: astroprincin family protein [Bacteroidota bacterium]